jgi:hypothetical protein
MTFRYMAKPKIAYVITNMKYQLKRKQGILKIIAIITILINKNKCNIELDMA